MAVAAIGVFGTNLGTMQVHLTLMLVFGIILITAIVQPYEGGKGETLLQRLEIGTLIALFCTMWAASVFSQHPRCEEEGGGNGDAMMPWCSWMSVVIGVGDILVIVVLVVCFMRVNVGSGVCNAVFDRVGSMLRAWRQSSMQARIRRRTVDARETSTSENPLDADAEYWPEEWHGGQQQQSMIGAATSSEGGSGSGGGGGRSHSTVVQMVHIHPNNRRKQ